MPSKSKKQHRFMEMVAHDPKAAKRLGISQDVGKEYVAADKGKKFGTGGSVRTDLQKANVKKTDHGQSQLFKEGGKTMATKKLFGGKETFKEELNEAKAIKSGKISPMQYAKGEESEKKMKKMVKGGKVKAKKYEDGGEVELESKMGSNQNIDSDTRTRAMDMLRAQNEDYEVETKDAPKAKAPKKAPSSSFNAKAKKARFNSAETEGGAALMTRKMAKGGKVRGCGIATKGLTKGKMV